MNVVAHLYSIHNSCIILQVVKSRFQSELTIPGLPRVYKYTLPSLVKIYREEGLSAIYKGFAPKAIRMGLGGAVAMASFELTQYMFMISP